MSRFPKERFKLNCSVCDNSFEVVKSRLTKAKYCSMRCMTYDRTISSNIHQCKCCGEKIQELATHRDQINRRGSKVFFCSRECFFSFNLIKLPIGSKRKCKSTGFIFVKTARDKWKREHRLIAERHIGRKLDYDSEPILHINGLKHDNSPENLYICKNQSEINILLKSYAAPYPVDGNLEWYK